MNGKNNQVIQTQSFKQTQALGKEFALQLSGGGIVLLYGTLGAGKTTFMQGLAEGLGIERRIISPTFIIVRRYEVISNFKFQISNIQWLYHVDLYRTQTEDDLRGLGLPEILQEKGAIVAIEWPEKLGSFLPREGWKLHFENLGENTREIQIKKYEQY